ncbi:MAG TPA: DUF2232 domain-containing protein [Pseudorhodoplanes sp.]|jgi:hypothetical protein|nr:DUF2232 domain-containing protein [Pseudorhodoplanes sp.]
MKQIVLIGLGAGAAAGLLFASILSGSALSVLLFYLAPLPILIAGIGWSHWSGLIGAIFAGAALGAVLGWFFFIAFCVGIGLPSWWLSYLALLARPLPSSSEIEWYPAGRMVVWCAIFGAFVVVATIPSFGFTEESFQTTLRTSLERVLRAQMRTPEGAPLEIPGADTRRLLDFLVTVTPLGIAVVSTVVNLFNVWLAARVVKVSGRLRRPWPDLPAMRFAPQTPLFLGAALAGSFLPGIGGIVASVFAAALLCAYAVLGFAVLHSVTAGLAGRPILLGIAYAASTIIYWAAIGVALIGLADTAFDIRGRVSARRGPPPATIR